MTAATGPGPRIVSLDIVRGVAVMGILAMNIVAFAMPFQAYMNPTAYGEMGNGDLASWAFSFIFVDGKMRGLFSFLFGASMLLVIERAEAGGQNAVSVHYRRMLWLLVFGLGHFYFIWFGDILAGYALIGMIAFLFRGLSPRALVRWGIGLVIVQLAVFGSMAAGTFFLAGAVAAPSPDPQLVAEYEELHRFLGPVSGQALLDKMALFQGPWLGLTEDRLDRWFEPFAGLLYFGWETLAYMLFGMAALKTGLLSGQWAPERYRRIALIGLALTIPVYAVLAWILVSDNFTVPMVLAVGMAATVPFRPVMVIAYAALIILLTRNGGALVERIAAAGRAAFTNYLGTSLLMTTLFYGYGLGLYGTFGRLELWIVVLAMWGLMLLWSKPWLDRFLYGPFEWLWRSLARGRVEPMRRLPPATPAAV
ncbi:MAG TPA: DUF418 domain-containing protein [Allosphingosinicella sp.]|nr:DUF418 domain-containing protein [Allosphingosinicella sp.]